MKYTYTLLLALINISVNAQFSYHQIDKIKKTEEQITKVEYVTVSPDATPQSNNFLRINSNIGFDLEKMKQSPNKSSLQTKKIENEEFKKRMESLTKYLNKQEKKIKRIKKRSEKNKKISKKNKSLYSLYNNITNIEEISFIKVTKPRRNIISTQALGGANFTRNTYNKNNGGIFEIGGKISNNWLRLPSKYGYKINENNGKYYVTHVKQVRTLNFDFISRGLLSLDSLQKSTSEYINTTLGSPFSLRLNAQKQLWPKLDDSDIEEPKIFFNFDLDGRVIPVFNASTIGNVGVSLHGMPSLIGVFPSGTSASDKAEDNTIVQLTGNLALLSNSIKEAISPDVNNNPLYGNVAISIEARVGKYSEVNPNKNWSWFAKYTWQKITGPTFGFGFVYAPQGKK